MWLLLGAHIYCISSFHGSTRRFGQLKIRFWTTGLVKPLKARDKTLGSWNLVILSVRCVGHMFADTALNNRKSSAMLGLTVSCKTRSTTSLFSMNVFMIFCNTYTCMSVHAHIHVYICMYVFVHTYTDIYTYIYVYMYIYI